MPELNRDEEEVLKQRLLAVDIRTDPEPAIIVCRGVMADWGVRRTSEEAEVAENTVRNIRNAWLDGKLEFLIPHVVERRQSQELRTFQVINFQLCVEAIQEAKQILYWPSWYLPDSSIPVLHLSDESRNQALELIRRSIPLSVLEQNWTQKTKNCRNEARKLWDLLNTHVEGLAPSGFEENWISGLVLIGVGLAEHLVLRQETTADGLVNLRFNTKALALGVANREALRLMEEFQRLGFEARGLARPLQQEHGKMASLSRLTAACLDEWLRF